MPPRTGPMRRISQGDTHVALSSTTVLPVRARPTCSGVYPMESRNVTICPEKDSTVR